MTTLKIAYIFDNVFENKICEWKIKISFEMYNNYMVIHIIRIQLLHYFQLIIFKSHSTRHTDQLNVYNIDDRQRKLSLSFFNST